jgi:hypothetical protein
VEKHTVHATAAVQQRPIEREWFVSWFDSAHYQRLYARRTANAAGGIAWRRLSVGMGTEMIRSGRRAGRPAREAYINGSMEDE